MLNTNRLNVRLVGSPAPWILLALLIGAQAERLSAQSPGDILSTAIASHGGSVISTIRTIRIVGQSQTIAGSSELTLSADLTGKVRMDYQGATTKSLIHTSEGESEIVGDHTEFKQPFVGLFAGLDMLSVFGVLRLQTGQVTWAEAGSQQDAGRLILLRSADTGITQMQYARTVKDSFQIGFDATSGLISIITRQQFAAKSMDVIFPVTWKFSDYREIDKVILPFHIDKYVSNRLAETIVVNTIELNPVLSNSLFER